MSDCNSEIVWSFFSSTLLLSLGSIWKLTSLNIDDFKKIGKNSTIGIFVGGLLLGGMKYVLSLLKKNNKYCIIEVLLAIVGGGLLVSLVNLAYMWGNPTNKNLYISLLLGILFVSLAFMLIVAGIQLDENKEDNKITNTISKWFGDVANSESCDGKIASAVISPILIFSLINTVGLLFVNNIFGTVQSNTYSQIMTSIRFINIGSLIITLSFWFIIAGMKTNKDNNFLAKYLKKGIK
jgi:hypothetical protein